MVVSFTRLVTVGMVRGGWVRAYSQLGCRERGGGVTPQDGSSLSLVNTGSTKVSFVQLIQCTNGINRFISIFSFIRVGGSQIPPAALPSKEMTLDSL